VRQNSPAGIGEKGFQSLSRCQTTNIGRAEIVQKSHPVPAGNQKRSELN
jgi:hypothetical protein